MIDHIETLATICERKTRQIAKLRRRIARGATMAGKIEVRLQFPDTARDAAVILLEQLLTAINLGQVVGSNEYYQRNLEKWKENAAVTLSDAKVERSR